MKLLLAGLLSAVLIVLIQPSPVNKQVVHRASANTATVVAKPSTAQKAVQPQPEIKTAAEPVAQPQPVPQPSPVPTTHEALMAAAGIQVTDYGAVDYIISHESSWNENATEPTSGAHGLPQALPYSKTGCGWVDSVCQLSWANQYAISRYGGWWPAQAYWSVNRNW